MIIVVVDLDNHRLGTPLCILNGVSSRERGAHGDYAQTRDARCCAKANASPNNPTPPEEEMRRLLSFLGLKVGYSLYVRIGGQLRKLEAPPIPNTGDVHEMIRPLAPA
jgi:hypothetical protein